MSPDDPDTKPTVPTELGPPASGERIGKYLRTQRLGGGGMGEVWKAWDTALGRWVALKFLKGGGANDVARFRREAQMAAKLSHPSIASVFDVGDHDGRPFIAMQFIEGTTLKDFSRTDLRLRVRLLRDAARAVQVAHDHGILHRDLKPENLMATSRGPDWHVVVTDFGLARPLGGAEGVTVAGVILGTPGFMSPEQACDRKLTAATDVYGLGATLFALLTGRPPFAADHVVKFLRAVLDTDPPPPSRIHPEVSRELDQIVLKCLQKEPRFRYPTAAALADDLDRWLEGRPVEAHPPSAAYRLRKLVQRRPATAAALVLGVLVAAGAGTAWTVASLRAQRGVAEAAAAARRLEAEARIVEARDAWIRVLSIRPGDVEATAGLRRLDGMLQARAEAAAAEEEARRRLDAARAVVDRAERMLYLRDADPAEYRSLLEAQAPRVEAVVARCPRLAAGHALMGQIQDMLGRSAEAETSWKRAVELDPSNPGIRYGFGRFLMGRVWWMSTSGAAPQEKEARAREALAHLEFAREVEDPLQRAIAGILATYARGDFAEAERAAVEAIARHASQPGLEELHLLAALCTRDPRTRIERLTDATDLRPFLPVALLARANVLADIREWGLALADYDRLIRIAPERREGWLNRADLNRRVGRIDAALADYEALLARQADDATALVGRGACRNLRGDGEGALTDAEAALALRPSVPGWMLKGNALTQLRRFGAADGAFTAALELSPGHAPALAARANARRLAGDRPGALADCGAALKLDPGSVDALATRGAIRAEAGDRDRAIADFEEALRLARPEWPYRRQLEEHLRDLKSPR